MSGMEKEEVLQILDVLIENKFKELTQIVIFLNILCKKLNINSEEMWKEAGQVFNDNYEAIRKDSKQIVDLQRQINDIFEKKDR
ncbi:MAG: hypothetical protein KAI43_07500 [Candidatus Aureabacteria bacterium]|nr:hypothetical protein [Candidatus Auribacterota bacterium]